MELLHFFGVVDEGTAPASTISTIRTNTELVPLRAENLVSWLDALDHTSTLAGARVLEAGCGFGAVAAYLAAERGADVTGIDISSRYLGVAQRVAERIGLDRLSFREADMRDLGPLGPFDVVFVNNAFIYLTSEADADRAAAELFRVTAPGGSIVFHHANRWQFREPFSKAPLIHLLPAPLARLLGRITGWKHNHGRVRLQSPGELRRRLRRTGFVDVILLDPSGQETGWKRHVTSFYVVAARRPAQARV